MLSLSPPNHRPIFLRRERQEHPLCMAALSQSCSPELSCWDTDFEIEVHAWRQPLKEWLKICYQKETFDKVIDFLLVTLNDAAKKMQLCKSKSSQKKENVPVAVDIHLRPPVFRRENWEKFLTNLGFILEMPDTLPIYNVTLVSVLLSASISLDLLMNTQHLLTYLKELPFVSIKAILSLSQNDGNNLFRALTDVSIHHLSLENSSYKQSVEILYNQKSKLMEELGFSKSTRELQWRNITEKEGQLVMYMFLLNMFFNDELSQIKPVQV